MSDLHYIVDRLNAPPFEYNTSLLALRRVLLFQRPSHGVVACAKPLSLSISK